MAATALAAIAALKMIQFGKHPVAAFFVVMHAFHRRHTFGRCGIAGSFAAQIFQIGEAIFA